MPRFAGRAVNFAGWVLRNLGAAAEGHDRHLEALEVGQRHGTPEVTIAALEDLAEECLEAGDLGGAAARLAQARALLHGDLVFGWRLELKHQLITGRLALLAVSRIARWPPRATWNRAPRRWACPATPAWPGCSGTGPATPSACPSTWTRSRRTWTCSTAAWPWKRGGGPVMPRRTSP